MDRPWDAPGNYWPDQPGVVAGRDRTGGGTWMGVNAAGVVAAVLNRPGSLGPAPGKRSRGELPLLALTHETADTAAAAIATQDGAVYRSFNLIVADRERVWFIRNEGLGRLEAIQLSPGLHMMTAYDPDDLASLRTARHLPRFRAASPPEPPDWDIWASLLGDETGPRDASLSLTPLDGFGTVSASLLGVSAAGNMQWLFAPGRAGQTDFAPVRLPSHSPHVACEVGGCYTAASMRG